MKKLLLSACVALAVLGCGGDDGDLPPCVTCVNVYSKCGDRAYDSSTEFCSGGTVYAKCGGSEYKPSTHGCCNAATFALSTEFCSGNMVYAKCGSSDYNPSTHGCCNATTFALFTQFCSGSSVYSKCDGSEYNPSTHGCCNATTFALTTQFCSGNMVYSKCGGSSYNPGTQFCSNGTVKGEVIYQGQTYKTIVIGTQTWMAENLNYDPGTGNSACYDNQTSNCTIYGRLYDWSTAMGLASSCNSTFCSRQIQYNYRGICPSGWHIPKYADWKILTDYVGGDETAGKHLKAASGWNPYGGIENLDTYEFSALPGGLGNSGGSFRSVGYVGGWWSASENGSSSLYAYRRLMRYDYDGALWDYDLKSFLFSVRCVQD